MEYVYLFLWSLPLGFWYSSRFEWLLHYYFMHRKTWGITFGYERHHIIHHFVFGADHTYESDKHEEMQLIPMGKLHGPMLIGISSAPIWLIIGILSLWLPFLWPIGLSATIMLTLHFIVYETFHYVMHMKKDHWLKHWKVYQWLCAHHHLHHARMGMNLNVSNPLADLLSDTLIVPSETGFRRVRLPGFLRINFLDMARFYLLEYWNAA